MKRCPECRRDYYDDTLLYCLDDGNALLEGPATVEDPVTALFSATAAMTAVLSAESPIITANSIAVLPFMHMSSVEDDEYFCDGLAEELINALSKIDELTVAARTSAFSFKGKNATVSEIGYKLGVKTILEGSVRKSGDRLRITVQLINAADGYHLWSERYDRQMTDIFALQDEITLAIVEALKLKLLGSERTKLLKKATENPAAYEQYLRGRALWNKRTPSDLEKATQYFEKAITIDPEYSLPYSGITDCHALLAYFEQFAPHDLLEKAKASAYKAIELDETSAEANSSMAMYKLVFEFDLRETESRFKNALHLNPKLVTARYLYGTYLATQGRFDEAFVQHKLALELDPISQPLNGNFSRALYMARRYEDAIELAEKNLEIAPDFFISHYVLGVSYRQIGNMEKALGHARLAVSLSGFFAFKGELGVTLAMAGKEAEARELLAELEEAAKTRYVSPQWPSVICAALGETASALAFLEKASEVRAIQLLWLAVDPSFDPLRDEPHFREVMAKLRLGR